jgi:dienelactone hydrolase
MIVGTYLLMIAFVFEAAFAIYCMIAKSNLTKVRNLARIGAFALFVTFTLASVLEWSFRYYALAVLLLLLAIIGAVNLIRHPEERKPYNAPRIVWKAIGMTVLISIVTLPAILFPQHRAMETTGKYQVATANYTYTDTKRVETYTATGENRKLNVEFWYPQNGEGTYPLVFFSHGSFGVKESNLSLYNELASHGYVVVSIDHTYQSFFTTDTDGHTTLVDLGYMQEISAADAHSNKIQANEYFQKWMGIRMGDINFVIDHVLAETKNSSADRVYQRMDTAKIGVMGHSLGGSAALGIGRIRDDISAVIALESPFMYDIEGVKDGEFVFTSEKYPVPVLNVYSNSSWSHLAEWTQYAENNALLSNPDATTFNVHISGVTHLGLTDFALTSPILTRILDGQKSTTPTESALKAINKISLEFFDKYLKGEGEFTSAGTL